MGIEEGNDMKSLMASGDEWWEVQGEPTALLYCLKAIEFYDVVALKNLRRWKWWQTTTICLGSLATVVSAIPMPATWGEGFGWCRSIPAACATIAASMMGTFNYRSDAVRQGGTVDALRGELAKYRARAAPYAADGRLDLFMRNIRAIIAAEQQAWRAQVTPVRQGQ